MKLNMDQINTLCRYILDIIMCIIVWNNAPWSVALMLTVLLFAHEINNIRVKAMSDFMTVTIGTLTEIENLFRIIMSGNKTEK